MWLVRLDCGWKNVNLCDISLRSRPAQLERFNEFFRSSESQIQPGRLYTRRKEYDIALKAATSRGISGLSSFCWILRWTHIFQVIIAPGAFIGANRFDQRAIPTACNSNRLQPLYSQKTTRLPLMRPHHPRLSPLQSL